MKLVTMLIGLFVVFGMHNAQAQYEDTNSEQRPQEAHQYDYDTGAQDNAGSAHGAQEPTERSPYDEADYDQSEGQGQQDQPGW